MIKDLEDYLKDVQAINLKNLEQIVETKVLDSSGREKQQEIKIRENPAFVLEGAITAALLALLLDQVLARIEEMG